MNQKTISNRISVTDFEAPELDIYARMNEIQLLNRHEPEKGMFIAESPKVIERAINAGYQPQSFLVDDEHIWRQMRIGYWSAVKRYRFTRLPGRCCGI